MGSSQATNQITRNVRYELQEGTTTEIVFGGSPGTITYNGTLYLYPRSSKVGIPQIFPPNVSTENAWLIDGNYYGQFQITGDSAFNALWDAGTLTGYYHVGYRLTMPATAFGFLRYTQVARYNESLARLMEKLEPRFNAFQPVSMSQSIPAGESVTGSIVGLSAGDLLYIQMAISQDTLGTSPHGSYIFVNDQKGLTTCNVVGALLPTYSGKIRVPYQVNGTANYTWTYKAYNGDSLAHFFLLNIYGVYA